MSVKVRIVTLLSTSQHSKSNWVFSIDVTAKKIDKLLQQRSKEGFGIHENLLDTEKSPEQDLKLVEGKAEIQFEIKGALKPTHTFLPGENVFSISKKYTEHQKKVVLSRNPDDTTTNATIEYTLTSSENKFLHRVCIENVPLAETGETEVKVLSDECVGGASAELQATPIPPRDEPEVGSCDYAEDGDVFNTRALHTSLSTSSFRDTSPRGLILSDSSLNTIGAALEPNQANQLFPILKLPEAISQQIRSNNPKDCTQQHYELFRSWRHRYTDVGVEMLYKRLVDGLSAIGRNDIKVRIEIAVSANRPLSREDLCI